MQHYIIIYEIVKLLLNAGADINKQNNDGDTALIYAAYNNNNRNC